MTDGDFMSEGYILDVFYGVGMSSGFLSAAEVDESLKPASWFLIGWLAATDQYKHISAPPKICLALEIAEQLFKLCIYEQIQFVANQKM